MVKRVLPIDALGAAIRSVLTPDLLKPEWRDRELPYAGHCYAASEAYYHLVGGKAAGYKPMSLRHEDAAHWYLSDPDGDWIDLTAEQFRTPVPYAAGRGCGFLTAEPSARAATIIARLFDAYPELLLDERVA